MNVAVILAGGIGSRVGAKIPKQFIEIKNKPILVYTLEIFQKNRNIDAIEVVCHKDWLDYVNQLVVDYDIDKTRWVTCGGMTFQESVMNGIYNLKPHVNKNDIVVISFGVSPMTSDEVINDSIDVCSKFGNGIASEDITLCTCVKFNEEYSVSPILRENLKGFSNPWSFKFGELCDAYEVAEGDGLLDSLEPHTTSLYFELNKKVYFSKSATDNIKITTKEDLDIFEGWLLLRESRANNLEVDDDKL